MKENFYQNYTNIILDDNDIKKSSIFESWMKEEVLNLKKTILQLSYDKQLDILLYFYEKLIVEKEKKNYILDNKEINILNVAYEHKKLQSQANKDYNFIKLKL